MTLKLLNEHLHTLQQYREAKERLNAMRAVVLGAQKFDGMPHAAGSFDKIEMLAIAISSQQADVDRLEKMVVKSGKVVSKFVEKIADNRTKLVFNLRFCCGMSWEEVAQTVGGGNTPESMKMCCYRYLWSINK